MVNIAVHLKLIAIDKGNSRTKVGLQMNDGDFEMEVFANTAESELLYFIKNIQFDAAIMSSVAALNFKAVSDHLQKNGKFIFVDSHTPLPIKNEYATPDTLGSDRIAGAIGAWKIVEKGDVVLFDTGTCINCECIVNNTYIGGAISPGLQMRLRAMHEYTGKLPLVEMPENEISFTGNTTVSCILSGAVHGTANELAGLMNQYRAKYPEISVVLSGGDAPFLGKYLKNSIFATHEEVVLVGLIEILKYNLNV